MAPHQHRAHRRHFATPNKHVRAWELQVLSTRPLARARRPPKSCFLWGLIHKNCLMGTVRSGLLKVHREVQ